MHLRTVSFTASLLFIAITFFAPVISHADRASEIQARIDRLLAEIAQLRTELVMIQTPPNIYSFTGPATTTVGERGTWTINATNTRTYIIDWKDGAPSGNQDFPGKRTTVTHKYNRAGTYIILLTARNAAGVATSTARVTVVNKPTPTINSFTGPATLYAGDRGTWTIDATNTRTYIIDWKDGVPGGDQDFPGKRTAVTHKYEKAGTYTILLTARNASGIATTSASVVVTTRPAPVITSFSGPATLKRYEKGTWTINATNAARYKIDWMDGQGGGDDSSWSGSTTTVEHRYRRGGTYNILLTAFGPGGFATTSTSVVVSTSTTATLQVSTALEGIGQAFMVLFGE